MRFNKNKLVENPHSIKDGVYYISADIDRIKVYVEFDYEHFLVAVEDNICEIKTSLGVFRRHISTFNYFYCLDDVK